MTKQAHNSNFVLREKKGAYPKEGDIFYYKFKDLGYGYGRVIADSDEKENNKNKYLCVGTYIYLYDYFTKDLEDNPKLGKDNLLLPPMLVLPSEFTTGPFIILKNEKLDSKDILEVNCMYKRKVPLIKDGDNYYDFFTKKEISRSEPCGVIGIFFEPYIDALISEAKGVKFAENPTTKDRTLPYKYW